MLCFLFFFIYASERSSAFYQNECANFSEHLFFPFHHQSGGMFSDQTFSGEMMVSVRCQAMMRWQSVCRRAGRGKLGPNRVKETNHHVRDK